MFGRSKKRQDSGLSATDEEEQGLIRNREDDFYQEDSQAEIGSLAQKYGCSEDVFSGLLAGGTILNHLMDKDQNQCGLNQSIYDGAIVMPQIARTAGWPKSLVDLTIRSYIFLFFNFVMQIFILYLIATEEEVMDKFAGKMSLCNFGANIHTCPDGPDCIGPAGTNFENAGRLYSYDTWNTRNYVRDSLRLLFPDKVAEINEKIDPGEYGVENFWVRYICVFIFMMSVMSDLQSTMDLCFILWCIPAKAQPWMTYDVPSWASKEKVKEVKGLKELDLVTFKIAGMPRFWKIVNFGLIIVPKLFIWRKTAKYGVIFLMNTAGIEDVIVNVTALAFILNLDEAMFQTFSHKALHHILQKLEPWELPRSTSGLEACDRHLHRNGNGRSNSKKNSSSTTNSNSNTNTNSNCNNNSSIAKRRSSSSGSSNNVNRGPSTGASSSSNGLGRTRSGSRSKAAAAAAAAAVAAKPSSPTRNPTSASASASASEMPALVVPTERGEGKAKTEEKEREELEMEENDDYDEDDDYDYYADLMREQDEYEKMTMEEIYQSVVKDQNTSIWSFNLIPVRLLVTVFFTLLYIWEYYQTKCEASARGGWISVTEALPMEQVYPILAFVLPWYQDDLEETPYWTMPQPPASSGG